MSVWPPGPTNPVKDHAVLFLLAGEAEEQEEAEDVAEAPLSNPRFFLARADLVWRTRERERERATRSDRAGGGGGGGESIALPPHLDPVARGGAGVHHRLPLLLLLLLLVRLVTRRRTCLRGSQCPHDATRKVELLAGVPSEYLACTNIKW